MTISGKMMTGFSLIIVIMALANGYVLLELHSVSVMGQTTMTADFQTIDHAKLIKSIVFDEERNGRKYFVSEDEVYYQLFMDDERRFRAAMDSLAVLPHGIKEAGLITKIMEVNGVVHDMIEHTELFPDRQERTTTLGASFSAIHSTLDQLVTMNQASIEHSMTAIERTTQRSVKVAYVTFLSAIVLALGAALLIASTITRPIRTLIRGTQDIASGVFNPLQVRSRDEVAQLGNAINTMGSKLKELEELRTEMMHHIAHELRTPLTTMMTAHYVLVQQRMGPLNAEQLRLLSAIRQNIDRLTDFSYDFLDLAKIEAGMMRFNVERTDPAAFVEPLIEEARLTAMEKEISVDLVRDHAPAVLIDRKRFSQVVTNLLSNAVKYSNRRGKITVTVDRGQVGARIAVSDTGVGITQEDLPHVFEKFYRARWTGGKGASGTGVGLALVKAVVEGHGGRVSVESKPGVGSTFAIDIPPAPSETDTETLFKDKEISEIGHG